MELGRWRIGAGAAAVLLAGAVVGAVLTQALSTTYAVQSAEVSIVESGSASGDEADEILVDVQGAVVAPGVYLLPGGARIVDALARAGGATADGDTSALNLALELVDGSQVLVPTLGADPTATPAQPGAAGSTLVSINQADSAQLETLPRIGPALAAAIIAYRTEHGSFETVAALEQVPGIGPSLMAQLEPLVSV